MSEKTQHEIAQEIAARIWGDPDYANVNMNIHVARTIGSMLLKEAEAQAILLGQPKNNADQKQLVHSDVIAYAGPRMKREFEQLTEDRNEWKKEAYAMAAKADAAKADNERMRAALEWYADAHNLHPDSAEGTTDIARAALEAQP